MAKEFKNGERVEFRPWETAPAKDRVTGESGRATMYNVAFRYNGRDYLQNVWVPKSAVYYYRASTCKLSVDDWVLKKVVELAVANPNKPFVDRGALLNGVEW